MHGGQREWAARESLLTEAAFLIRHRPERQVLILTEVGFTPARQTFGTAAFSLLALLLPSARNGAATPGSQKAAAAGFLYLAEDDALVQGRPAETKSCYVSRSGLVQQWRSIGETVTWFAERTSDVTRVFGELPSAVAANHFPVVDRSETGADLDGSYRPYQQFFFGLDDISGPLHCGLVQDSPPALAGLLRQIHELCPAGFGDTGAHSAEFFLQASILERNTAQRFREQKLLRVLTEPNLASASLASRALHEPFRLIRCSESELRDDAVANKLNLRQPVIDLDYAGTAFQLRLRTAKPAKTQ